MPLLKGARLMSIIDDIENIIKAKSVTWTYAPIEPNRTPTGLTNEEALTYKDVNIRADRYHRDAKEDHMITHFYTIDSGERAAAIANMSAVSEGDSFWVFSKDSSDFVPMFRLYHPEENTHLFTTFVDERDAAINEQDYEGEGIGFWCLAAGAANGSNMVNLFRAYNPVTDDHFYTLQRGEIFADSDYKDEGVAAVVFSVSVGGLAPLFRLRSPSGHHFYTVDSTERQALLTKKYVDEGTCGFVSPTAPNGPAPFFRAYHPTTGGHLYTVDIAESDLALKQSGYRGDGISCFIFQDGTQLDNAVPLFRCFNANLDDHFYTTDATERDNAITALGYKDEGLAGWVLSPAVGQFDESSVPVHRLRGDFKNNFFLTPPGPPKALSSNSNFILNSIIGAGTDAILGLSVEIDLSSDVQASSVNKGVMGFGFQLNAFSPQNFTSGYQQYVLRLAGKDLHWAINNYSASSYAISNILGDEKICTLKSAMLAAGMKLTIQLIYDAFGNVLGATFSAYSGKKKLGDKTALIKDINNGIAFGAAPIIGFQMVLVGYGGGAQTTLTPGGGGVFRYEATTPLFAEVTAPANSESPTSFTVETANSTYGEISATKSRELSQTFGTGGTTFSLPWTRGIPRTLGVISLAKRLNKRKLRR
jgi:Repeat of unknown function (DUF5648)